MYKPYIIGGSVGAGLGSLLFWAFAPNTRRSRKIEKTVDDLTATVIELKAQVDKQQAG